MHFLVFVPCQTADLEKHAKVSGLSCLLGGHDVAPNMVGPNGESGTMLGWLSPTNPLIHYDAESQTWVQSINKDETGKPRYWVGFWNNKPPRENELRRNYTQGGPLTQFGSQTWKLPTPDTVDSRAVYNDDGSMRWEVVRQFSWVCDEAKQLHDQYVEEFGVRSQVFNVEPSEQIKWLLKLLQINYRLLPEVAIYLDMWVGKDHIIDTVLATLDLKRKVPGNG